MLCCMSVSSFGWVVGSWVLVVWLGTGDLFMGRGSSFVTHKAGLCCEWLLLELSDSCFGCSGKAVRLVPWRLGAANGKD